jgi:hypothetical protein
LPRIGVAEPLQKGPGCAQAFNSQVEDLPRIGVAKPLQKSQSAVVRYLIKPFSLAQAFTPGDEDYGI